MKRAATGTEGMAMLESSDWDAIFLDVRLPDLPGPEIYRRLEQSRPQLAQRVVFVTGGVWRSESRLRQELPSLRSAGRLAHMLRTRYGAARVMAVMNRVDRRSEISHADVERVIGDSVKHLIPSDYWMALQAVNVGRPVALETGPLADSFRNLAGDLGGIVKQKRPASSGVFGRLAFRRA